MEVDCKLYNTHIHSPPPASNSRHDKSFSQWFVYIILDHCCCYCCRLVSFIINPTSHVSDWKSLAQHYFRRKTVVADLLFFVIQPRRWPRFYTNKSLINANCCSKLRKTYQMNQFLFAVYAQRSDHFLCIYFSSSLRFYVLFFISICSCFHFQLLCLFYLLYCSLRWSTTQWRSVGQTIYVARQLDECQCVYIYNNNIKVPFRK